MILASNILLNNFTWLNEFEFFDVVQSLERALNGTPTIEHSVITNGRKITLVSSLEESELYKSLVQHSTENVGVSFLLNIHGIDYNVAWDYETAPTAAETLNSFSDESAAYAKNIKLSFITVS